MKENKAVETDKATQPSSPPLTNTNAFDCVGFTIDGLETLPGEIQRNFKLMRQVDELSEDLKKQIEETSKEFLGKSQNYDDKNASNTIVEVQGLIKKLKEYAETKVELSRQNYEMVDKHIRRLDSELIAYDKDSRKIKEEVQNVSKDADKSKNKKRRKKDKSGTEVKKSRKNKKLATQDEEPVPFLTNFQAGPDVLDMPVDPNEPTYCLCRQVSYGEMIGCDNLNCSIEWFHFGCVNLVTKPKGSWYCPKCEKKRKK